MYPVYGTKLTPASINKNADGRIENGLAIIISLSRNRQQHAFLLNCVDSGLNNV